MMLALVVFWGSAAGLAYAYVGYPLLLLVMARLRKPAALTIPEDPRERPSVALLVPVHNERANIEGKLANTQALRYDGGLTTYFISDGCTDGTAEYVREHADERTRLIELTGRGGKAGALNHALGIVTDDVVVFSDASIMLATDAIDQIVRPFADPRIGCVSGEDRIADAGGEGLYGRYELFVRRKESAVGSLIGASGSFYAQRRTLCEPFVPNLAPDFWSVLRVVEQGYRAVSAPNAVGSMSALHDVADEFRRKVRTLLRGITTLVRYAHLMNPFAYGFFAIQLLSHKLARWLVPFFLLGTFIGSAVLTPASAFYAALFVVQLVLYLLALTAHLGLRPLAEWRLARVSLYFSAVNIATLVAWSKYFAGVRQEIWTPSQR